MDSAIPKHSTVVTWMYTLGNVEMLQKNKGNES